MRRGGPSRAGTARPVRSGTGGVRVPHRRSEQGFRGLPRRADQSACVADDQDAAAVRPVREDAQPTPLIMTYALIPGAGGSAWYWHRVAPLLPDAIAIELPADDDSADLTTYADTVVDAVSGAPEPLIVAAQSMGAFTAPLVA